MNQAKRNEESKRQKEAKQRIIKRFIVVGDMHKSIDNTGSTDDPDIDDRSGEIIKPRGYSDRLRLLLSKLKSEKQEGLDFILFNGDLIHSYFNSPKIPLLRIKYNIFDNIGVPLYAGYGNHDRATEEEWKEVFGHGRDHAFSDGEYGFIILNTSDTEGARQICIGKSFLEQKLNEYSDLKGVFVFTHIPRYSGIRDEYDEYDSPECTDILDLLKKQDNLVSVIQSHFHEDYRTFEKDGVNYWFTGHVAQYGINFYGYRIIEINENGTITTKLYDMTNEEIKTELTI